MLINFFPAMFIPDVGLCTLDSLASLLVRLLFLLNNVVFLSHLLWCWERLRAEGEEGIRGWDGWMASPMQWTWAWANFWRWWGTGRPAALHGVTKSWTQLGNWKTSLLKSIQANSSPWVWTPTGGPHPPWSHPQFLPYRAQCLVS